MPQRSPLLLDQTPLSGLLDAVQGCIIARTYLPRSHVPDTSRLTI